MAFKIVGADENSDFPTRVENKLKTKFAAKDAVGDKISTVSATGLAAGAAPTATLGGTSAARTIAFGIPKGDKGDTGAVGPKGDKGDPGKGVVEDPTDPGFFI